MKHRILPALCAAALLLTGCGGTSSSAAEKKTYIPSNDSIEYDLKQAGYQVKITDVGVYSMISATNGKEQPDFEGLLLMRADSADTITQQKSQKAESEKSVLFVRTNDPEYGNILISGTQKALKDAGITLAD